MAPQTFAILLLAASLAAVYGVPLTSQELQEIRRHCPPTNGRLAVYVPHPADCAVFFQCDHGRPMEVRCPQGLHFNPEQRVCDFANRAGCKAKPRNGGFVSITAVGRRPSITNYQPVMTRDSRCWGTNRGLPIFLAHETQCSQYYVCDNGMAIHMLCPQGLQFNTVTNVCDYPERVQCPQNVAARAHSGPSLTEPVQDQESSDPKVMLSGDRLITKGKPDPRCPSENGNDPIFLPHETSCTDYYVCDYGLAILMGCAPPLHFSPDKNVCDYPDIANCPNRVQRAAAPAAQNEKEESSAKEEPAPEPKGGEEELAPRAFPLMRLDARCPKHNPAVPIMFVDDKDCGRYYVCDWGYAISMLCPTNFGFDETNRSCSIPKPC